MVTLEKPTVLVADNLDLRSFVTMWRYLLRWEPPVNISLLETLDEAEYYWNRAQMVITPRRFPRTYVTLDTAGKVADAVTRTNPNCVVARYTPYPQYAGPAERDIVADIPSFHHLLGIVTSSNLPEILRRPTREERIAGFKEKFPDLRYHF